MTAPAPRPCLVCGAPAKGLYCGEGHKNLAWQQRNRDKLKAAKQAQKQIPLMPVEYVLPTPDRILFCPTCGGDKQHRPDGELYRCGCRRLRMTPEQSRRIEREYPAYRVETEKTG